MSEILFFFLCAQIVGVIVWAFFRAERLNHFSSLLAISCGGFALPQLHGLLGMTDTLPPGGLPKMLIMFNLCFACAIIGFNIKVRPATLFQWSYTRESLLVVSAILTCVGGVCYFEISRLPEEMINAGQWTGKVNLYNFCATALPYGLVIALFLVLKKPSFPAILLAVVAGLLLLDRAVLGGRRTQAVILLLSVTLSFWLFKKKTVSRPIFLAIAIAGSLLVYSIADYRNAIAGEGRAFNSIFLGGGFAGFKGISNISFIENVKQGAKKTDSEFVSAVFGIADTDLKMSFDFGLSHWDGLVNFNIPGQLVGRDFKESLKFNLNKSERNTFGFEKDGATPEPGILDAFRSFWYFGCIKFLLIGLFMQVLLTSAFAGNLNFAFVYIFLIPHSLLIVAYPIDFFIGVITHAAIFVGGTILLVRIFWPSGIISSKSIHSGIRCFTFRRRNSRCGVATLSRKPRVLSGSGVDFGLRPALLIPRTNCPILLVGKRFGRDAH